MWDAMSLWVISTEEMINYLDLKKPEVTKPPSYNEKNRDSGAPQNASSWIYTANNPIERSTTQKQPYFRAKEIKSCQQQRFNVGDKNANWALRASKVVHFAKLA